ncbi:50S ribosomal protein L22 [Acholeplasma sp. OttesenSCG-928-E16]|nr:50S ribosomal protein L22 [Acholeplasma sp. OttesenSCG-928-E16]
MEAKAIAKTIRITPRKARLVIDLIRGKNIKEAEAILMFTPRAASPIISKVLKSAVANAEHNLNLNADDLYVKECYVSEGVRIKRMMPRAKGQGDIIQKRTSHITVVVAERE